MVDDPRFESAFTDTEWQSLEREPRLVLRRRLFGRGEKLFEALLTVDADNPAALSALADWYWFYRKRDRALKLYRQAALFAGRFRASGALAGAAKVGLRAGISGATDTGETDAQGFRAGTALGD